jgi:putative restriction endonuclease
MPLPVPAAADDLSTGTEDTATIEVNVQRVVRSTKVGRAVNEMHDHRCQVCGMRIELASGYYAEATHIKPLGKPHNGPDALSNILCLCPNDRVRFDFGAIVITDDLEVMESGTATIVGRLNVRRGHEIDREYLAYHRSRFGY